MNIYQAKKMNESLERIADSLERFFSDQLLWDRIISALASGQ